MKKFLTYFLILLMNVNSYAGPSGQDPGGDGNTHARILPTLNDSLVVDRPNPIAAYQVDGQDRIVILEGRTSTYTGAITECSKFGPASVSTPGELGESPSVCWVSSQWESCTSTCGDGVRTRDVSCVDLSGASSGLCRNELKPNGSAECSSYSSCSYEWKTGDWGACSPACGDSQQNRSVQCERVDGVIVDESNCDLMSKPPISSPCIDNTACGFVWETGTWNTCSTTCGVGIQERDLYCKRNDNSYVELSKCNLSEEPNKTQNCENFTDCTYSFEYSEWGSCSSTCGEGTRERSALCKRSNGDVVENTNCIDSPVVLENCVGTSSCSYSWDYSEYGSCSTSCGTGLKSRTATCQRSDGVVVQNSFCTSEATLTETCSDSSSCTTAWNYGSWGACSTTCGSGTETRTATCLRSDGATVANAECTGSPTTSQACSNTTGCTYSWDTTAWGSCSTTCGTGTQSRTSTCKRSDGTTVADGLCPAKPASSQACTDISTCTTAWNYGSWGACSTTCGSGTESRTATCLRSDGTTVANAECAGSPTTSQACSNTTGCTYSWDTTAWGSCSTTCGTGTQSRTSTCKRSDGTTVLDNLCPAKPASSQACSDVSTCTYSWDTTTWGACSNTCGNGTQSRTSTCKRSDGTSVADTFCIAKPSDSQACTGTSTCTYNWNYSSYGSCSTTCGTGTQTRTATCLRSDGTTVTNVNCTATAVLSQACTVTTGCTYAFEYSSWGACTNTCGAGTQTRTAVCKRSDGTVLDNSYCGTPSTSQACSVYTGCTYSWNTGSFGACSTTCGTGTQTRIVNCRRSDGATVANTFCTMAQPAASQACSLYTGCTYSWVYGGWGACNYDECGISGSGYHFRSATCKRTDGLVVAAANCAGSPITEGVCY